MPELEAVVTSALGAHPEADQWLSFELDAVSQSPVLLFPYPRAVAPGSYIPPLVKMEPMFLSPPPDFDMVLATLREAEETINIGANAAEAIGS